MMSVGKHLSSFMLALLAIKKKGNGGNDSGEKIPHSWCESYH